MLEINALFGWDNLLLKKEIKFPELKNFRAFYIDSTWQLALEMSGFCIHLLMSSPINRNQEKPVNNSRHKTSHGLDQKFKNCLLQNSWDTWRYFKDHFYWPIWLKNIIKINFLQVLCYDEQPMVNDRQLLINGQVDQVIIQKSFRGEWCSHLKIQRYSIEAEWCANFSYLSLQENMKPEVLLYFYVQGLVVFFCGFDCLFNCFHFIFNLVFVWLLVWPGFLFIVLIIFSHFAFSLK